MADQLKGRTRRHDDSMVPLLTGVVVLAAVGPALLTAVTQWLTPRATAGGAAVAFTLGSWWERNWWLAVFWAVELMVLLVFLAWSRRRQRRRQRQLAYVAAELARVLPSDWDPQRHLRVLRWRGDRPDRLRVQLTPTTRSTAPQWRESFAAAVLEVFGRLEPIHWPEPPRGGVFDWRRRPPQVDLRVARTAPAEGSGSVRVSDRAPALPGSTREQPGSIADPDEPLPIYRRPRSTAVSGPAGEVGPMSVQPVRNARED